MADEKIQNGQAEYGVVHVMENEMREAGQGVFEAKSGELGQKSAGPAPKNKMEPAPENKSLSSMTKAELVATAEAEGVKIETDDNKADLVAKIEKARK